MPAPLLDTKIYLPCPRSGLVPRPRLGERLEHGAKSKLMLVSAPAGFGKTTLLAQWLGTRPAGPVGEPTSAWLSLDRADNDPATFWTYVIAALRTVVADLGENELALLTAPQPPIDLVLTTLLNDLGSTGADIVLVLDDFHLIESQEVHEALALLIDRMPSRLHLVIASRADPAIPLARLRGRRELVEIRASELRFTATESAAYLNEVMGLQLVEAEVAALEGRTEGWIAALQLAALSMQGRDDVAAFIAGFSGDDRYIVDYLAEEVLQRQPAEVRDFLLQTALLGRLNGSLCDAVTGTDGGADMLRTLERRNLFVVPLDDRREWYRYHHLFADVLRSRLAEEPSDLVQDLHRRASDWYATNSEPAEAIEHAIAGRHFERAADLAEQAMPAMGRDRQEVTLRRWVELLPDGVLQTRPVLSNGYAGSLLSTGVVDGVEKRLSDVERWLESGRNSHAPMGVANEEFRRLPAGVAVHRAGLALMGGDVRAAVAHARRALLMLEAGDDLLRGAATALIGLASWTSGDLVSAEDAYAKCLDSMQRAGHVADLLGCSIALADIQITLGHRREAQRTYEKALRLATGGGGPVLRGTADMYVGLSAILREQNDLESSGLFLARSEDLGEQFGLPQNPYRSRVARARLREAEGDLAGAEDLLDQAEQVYEGDFSPDVRPIAALRARVWILQGNIGDALDWARGKGLSGEDELSYVREYEHVTLARVLLARGESDAARARAIALLKRLLEAAESGQRTDSVIEILVLHAIALHNTGNDVSALGTLERALLLAEPEGYVRVFIDEGPAMAALLQKATRHGLVPGFVNRLLAAPGGPLVRATVGSGLIDPLSRRELEVLRLLGTDLAGPEIARELFVSLNTVRTHTRSIYAKLGVNNRRAAVRRAVELGQ